MDRKETKIDPELKNFLERINKKFNIEKAILFGSRARGDNRRFSDYDIILVSDDFEGIRWIKRIEMLIDFWESDKDIDILPYTSEEFKEKSSMRNVVRVGVEEGIAIV